MNFAQEMAKSNPVALTSLVRVLLRPLQSELLISSIENKLHEARNAVEPSKFFMPNISSQLQKCWKYPKLNSENFSVYLNRDAVLTCPWHRDRYVGAMSDIGLGKSSGSWRQDSNHGLTIWLPWGIVFVGGGNHSIAAGILEGDGVLRPEEVYDMSGLLDLVQCDGKHYRLVANGKVIDVVHDYKIAACFEIGRLMQQHQITPMLNNYYIE